MPYVGLGPESTLVVANYKRIIQGKKAVRALSQTALSLPGSREERAKVPMRTAVTLFAAMRSLFIGAALIRL